MLIEFGVKISSAALKSGDKADNGIAIMENKPLLPCSLIDNDRSS